MQFDIRRRYHPKWYFGFDKLTMNGFCMSLRMAWWI